MTEPLTLVHTMGRVGSTSTVRALQAAGVEALHVHHLNPRTLAALPDSRHVRDGWRARQLIEADDQRPVQLVTLVRDPVERNVSAAFARFRRHGDVEQLQQLVADPAATTPAWAGVDTDLPARWFDDEVRQPFGIDVYRKPAADVVRFGRGRVRLLVLSSRLDPAAQGAALSRFLGQPVTVRRNDSATRDGGALHDVYAAFRRSCPWSIEDLWSMIGSRFGLHFHDYGDEPAEHVQDLAWRLGIV